jgi:hypothetical protein
MAMTMRELCRELGSALYAETGPRRNAALGAETAAKPPVKNLLANIRNLRYIYSHSPNPNRRLVRGRRGERDESVERLVPQPEAGVERAGSFFYLNRL